MTTARAGNLRTYLNSIGQAGTPVFFEEDDFLENGGAMTVLDRIRIAQDCKAAGCSAGCSIATPPST